MEMMIADGFSLTSEILDPKANHKRSVLGSSEDMTWPTPQYLFDAIDLEFGFTLDPCCWPHTAKCDKYYTPKENGLAQDWSAERVFMNPPYGAELGRWMAKAFGEAQRGALVVCLVPARVDTNWWHDYANRGEIRFLKGRVLGPSGQSWPFPVAIVVFRPKAYELKYWELPERP
jgi:site-specific DNA-methyltransferase (adenine-specific)